MNIFFDKITAIFFDKVTAILSKAAMKYKDIIIMGDLSIDIKNILDYGLLGIGLW